MHVPRPLPVSAYLPGRSPAGRTQALAALLAAGCGALLFYATHRVLPDDAFITLDYARNLAEHGHWGLLADRPANTATSPLHVWLLAGLILLIGRPVLAVGVLLVVAFALIGWWAAQLARDLARSPAVVAALVVALLVCSPLLVSTVGLESYLGAAALLGVARYAVAGRAVVTGLLVGVAVLTRPDLAVPAVVLALGLLVRAGRWREGALGLLMAALVALPWHLWSWWALGSVVPDTLAVKTHRLTTTAVDRGVLTALFSDNYQPWRSPPASVACVLLLGGLACGLAALARLRRGDQTDQVVVAMVGAGLAHLWALDLIRATAHTWYYAPALACAAVAVALTAARWRAMQLVAAAVIGVSATVTVLAVGAWPWRTVPMQGNTATAEHYAAVGQGLATILPPGAEVASNGEVGAVAFYCRCAYIDHLSDEALVQPYLDAQYAAAGPLGRTLLGWNYAHRAPAGPAPRPGFVLRTGPPGSLPPGVASWTTDGPVPRTSVLYRR